MKVALKLKWYLSSALLALSVAADVLGLADLSGALGDLWNQTEVLQVFLIGVTLALVISVLVMFRLLHQAHGRTATRERNRARVKKTVVFVAPSLDGFYGEYLTRLVRAAKDHGASERDIAIVPYVNTVDGSCPEERLDEIFETIAQNESSVEGIFVIPKDPQANQEKIKLFSKCPIVTLDVYPDVTESPGYPHFVGGDEELGGQCAANQALIVLQAAAAHRPPDCREPMRVLVLTGSQTRWESQRVDAFRQRLDQLARENGLNVTIVVSPPLDYDYEKAVSYVRNWQVRTDQAGAPLANPLELRLIFACSDTMAFGAAKALRQLRNMHPQLIPPKIIGYDGTLGMQHVLNAGSDVFVATVNVRLDDQAKKAVGLMMELLRDPTVGRQRMHRVTPEIFT
jgi:ABC-type sugar transport system substrate-binding protein